MPKSNSYRIVIDTNLWISFIISKKYSAIEKTLLSTNSVILFSEELIEELRLTIQKPKLQKYFSVNAFDEMMQVFDDFIELIEVKSAVNDCRDEKDNFLLALAIDGKADYLLSGDKDLLILNPYKNIEICSYSDFEILNQK